MATTTTPRIRFTVKELIQIGCHSQLLKRMPGSASLALYRVEGSDAALYGCACCDKPDKAESMRNFGRYIVCGDCGMQISRALHKADCHRGIPRGGFTVAITLKNVTDLEAKDNGEHARIAADKLESEPGFLDNLFSRAAREEQRSHGRDRRDRRDPDHADSRGGPMADALRNVRGSTPPDRPATPIPAATVAAAVAIAAPAQPESQTAASTSVPEPVTATAEDPIAKLNLAAVTRMRSDLKRVRAVLGDAEYARQLKKLIARQRQLEDAELAELLGKDGESVASAPTAPAAAPVPTPAPSVPVPTPVPPVEEPVDLGELTFKVLHDACSLDTCRQIKRGEVVKAGAEVRAVTCVVAANSVACKAKGPPSDMAAFRGHPNLGAGKSNMFPICRTCRAIALADDELADRINKDRTYADILAEEERERRSYGRRSTPASGAAHTGAKGDAKTDKGSNGAEPTASERALLERIAGERIYTCVKTKQGCPLQGQRIAKVFDPATRQPTTDTAVGVCGKCLARMPKSRKAKAAPVAEAPKPAKLSKEEREALKREARQGR